MKNITKNLIVFSEQVARGKLGEKGSSHERTVLSSLVLSRIVICLTAGIVQRNPRVPMHFFVDADRDIVAAALEKANLDDWEVGASVNGQVSVELPDNHAVVYLAGGPHAGRLVYIKLDQLKHTYGEDYLDNMQRRLVTAPYTLTYQGAKYAVGSMMQLGATPLEERS